ncbi:MAG: T9SS type A sorting domain-containing protein, partial [Bacteroidales bacterium]|nr:T9SS type A sorting domain-containing protein [Bacteroidales bacterium]
TKDYRAIYLATYGNGIYVDKSFVNDTLNEVGIADVEPENIGAVRIYPNPAASYTNVELQVAKTTDATVRVFDMSGKVVYTKSLENLTAGVHTEAINCQGLQKGVYLINVVTDSQMMTSKLVVK